MADWFKFYQNALDETRFQYALNKLPEVLHVYVGIMCECCAHKSNTIVWSDGEIELFGFSQRLHVSLGKVNEGLNLLVDIGYIERKNGHIKVLKWNDLQSAYCQRIKGAKKQCANTSSTVAEQCVLRGEERRGDKSREDEKRESTRTRFVKPSFSDLELYARDIGLPATELNHFQDYYESNGWRVGRNPMRDWKAALRNWNLRYRAVPTKGAPAQTRTADAKDRYEGLKLTSL